MPEESKAHFRRSRSLLALAFFIPGAALALFNFLGHIGLFWQLVQMALMGAGAIIFWREAKRIRTASLQSERPPHGDDRPMFEHPKIKLSHLREIGWLRWDPIGLSQMGDDDWKDGGHCADEYDTYLLGVVGRLRRGDPVSQAVAYLEEIEIEHMGGGRNATTRSRADATVAAIAEYLATLPAGPLKVR